MSIHKVDAEVSRILNTEETILRLDVVLQPDGKIRTDVIYPALVSVRSVTLGLNTLKQAAGAVYGQIGRAIAHHHETCQLCRIENAKRKFDSKEAASVKLFHDFLISLRDGTAAQEELDAEEHREGVAGGAGERGERLGGDSDAEAAQGREGAAGGEEEQQEGVGRGIREGDPSRVSEGVAREEGEGSGEGGTQAGAAEEGRSGPGCPEQP